ncbi:ABC transporter ATP-binding protein/permease [Paenibacillus sp. ACRRX]|uniref:ABC transporter ATP-binding protein n=1 Tax=unclassified Paenibacillus TaxID=185978 RepID=UPI001EF44AB9|nr:MULTISPECIES: ABC transporter ATP-binding protein [unclassified Paenibacillus]MCG7408194.1 ABC transporter ATP-binding protein/permease [Paenibacillus sp. ACRRX]MDK8181422.1 ABC transporter ATP-binding protein [Paenibacillus sp. UMB4589-SE434]
MKKVLSYLKPYRIPMGFAITLMLIELAVELLQPLLIAKIINEGITPKNMNLVLQWGGVMLGLAFIGFACGIINSYYASRVAQNYSFDLRRSLFDRIQSFSFANFNQFPTATLITRVTSDVTQVQNCVFMAMRIMMRAPLLLLGGLIMALVVHVKLALILAVVTPLMLVFLVWMMKKGFVLFRSVQEKLDRANSVLRENLLGMRLIKSFVRSKHEEARFAAANQELVDRTVAVLRLMETAVPVLLFVMNVSVLLILWIGHDQVLTGGANIGEVVAVVNYAARITGAFSVVSMIVMTLSRARASAQRIEQVLTAEADVIDKEQASQSAFIRGGGVRFDEVTFVYPEHHVPVLDRISFAVEPGQIAAIMGATGAGKSTLFQLIPRLYDVTMGCVCIDELDVRDMLLDHLRGDIGYVPQEAMLFSGTIADNIRFGHEGAAHDEVVDAAQRAQIHETIMRLPNQYDTVIGQKGINLSGGQKQRLSIARALVRRPKLLLLDDSTSALDVKTEAKLLRALPTASCTTLMITQKISTAIHADIILLLDEGKLLAAGSHDELLQRSVLYQRMVESQFGKEAVPHD